MQTRLTVTFVAYGCAALAQRPGDTKQSPVPPLLQQYDFGAQVRELQKQQPTPAIPVGPRLSPVTPAPATPQEIRARDIPLGPSERTAVKTSEGLRAPGTPPTAGPDGRVLYSFGDGLPAVVCAPLRICIVELQAGEKITGEPQIGDSVRWMISPATYGAGERATAAIVLKPQSPGLDTNLLITTDRRAYYLRLVSKPEEYVARVAFVYPADESAAKWQRQIATQRAQEKLECRPAETGAGLVAAENLNFRYRIAGGDANLRPTRVFDDGAKTFVQMPAEMRHREAPALLVLGKDGKGEMTNYRVKEQTYIVDRLFDRATLILGSGKKAQKVEITREPQR